MKLILILVSGLFAGKLVLAQVTESDLSGLNEETPGFIRNLNINQDPRVEEMLNWHLENNKINKKLDGYRVEIFFSSDINAKEQALKKKVEFLTAYPNNTVHIKYIAPNFRVRVGDFRTKNEALKLYREIKDNYPVAFIVSDNIDFPLMKPLENE